MKYPLQALLSVRQLRESSALEAKYAAERKVNETKEHIARLNAELVRYRAWHVEETDRRYAQIMGKNMLPQEVTDFKAGLARLDEEELLRQDEIREAEKLLAEDISHLDTAREELKRAQKETMKISLHKDIWDEQEKKEAEYMEEKEAEDISPKLALDTPGREGED